MSTPETQSKSRPVPGTGDDVDVKDAGLEASEVEADLLLHNGNPGQLGGLREAASLWPWLAPVHP